ncbi:CRISPR-associated helicase Cas3' [Lysinibacillus fusiformis]|nr:CRISPR-associated helicase Cas3' [Lysinibacillus fusiformis]
MRFQNYIAHIRESDNEEQLLKHHLKETQEIAEKVGEKIGIPHITGLAGMLHDMGKYSDEFQEYIRNAFDNPTNPPKRGSVNHSTAGGKYLMDNFHNHINKKSKVAPPLIESIANVIYSHHGQLLDMVNPQGQSPFLDRLTSAKIEFDTIYPRFFNEVIDTQSFNRYVEQANKEFQQLFKVSLSKAKSEAEAKAVLRKTFAFLTKFIFSALIDADRTNSREFDENIASEKQETKKKLFNQFELELLKSLEDKQKNAIPNQITKLRNQMSENCNDKAKLPTGIYTLSIPTGGGKTLASLRFALRHADIHNKERIINVIPFTTIIEQNAQEVRDVLNTQDDVLEHHSNVVLEKSESADDSNVLSFKDLKKVRKLKNAKDNWDAPIVFTTMVQFLNTFFDGSSRNTRRLHNLANSIIIFDEIQTLPVSCVSLFNEAINFLKDFCNTTIILCTATQPALEHVEHNISVDGELIDNLSTITKAFKRTEVIPLVKDGGWKSEEIADLVRDKLEIHGNMLVILNTKTVVKELYNLLKSDVDEIYHLSTSMCPAHRKVILEAVRDKLESGEKIVCISTQLIEAGVDVSFNCVIRSLAGLDSIAQAAGRCNRHGEASMKEVFVINHAGEKLDKLRTIKEGRKCTEFIIKDLQIDPELFNGSLLSNTAMEHYFQKFYREFESELEFPIRDYNTSIFEILLGKNERFYGESSHKEVLNISSSFKTAGEYFEVIDGKTYPILVPHGEGEELISSLTSKEGNIDFSNFIKQAQQYSVNAFKYEFDTLVNNHLLREVDFGYAKIYIALDNAYDKSYGLSINGEAKLEEYSF